MKKQILLVDDDPDLLKLVEIRLLSNEYDIITASDGKIALALLQNKPFDLVILDLILPHIDGYELFKILKETPNLSRIPTLILSCIPREIAYEKDNNLKPDLYMTKPFEPLILIEGVKKLLGI